MDNITLDELIACDSDGSRIVAFDREKGQPVHIKNAKNGKACECICVCGRLMIAYQGSNKHRFQHEGSAGGRTCQASGESALHLFAKDLLQNRLEIQIPHLTESDGRNEIKVTAAKRQRFESAVLEKKQGEIIPDVVCLLKDRKLQIEFAVTHVCSEEKIRKIKALDIASIEIDLSKFRKHTLDKLEEIILFTADREWLHNPKSEVARAKLREKEVERQEGIRLEANSLIKAIRAQASQAPIGSFEWSEKARDNEIIAALDEAKNVSPGFSVSDGEWKAYLLLELGISQTDGFTDKDAFGRIKAKSWILKGFQFVDDEISERVKLGGLSTFLSPWQSVTGFLSEMTSRGFLLRGNGWRYFGGRELFAAVKQAKRRSELPVSRRKELKDAVSEILQKARFEERAAFSFESWLSQYATSFGFEKQDIWLVDDETWRQLCDPILILLTEVGSPLRVITDLHGLPISDEVARRISEIETRELQRKEEAKRREDELADKRLRELEARAQNEKDWRAETARPWLATLRTIAVRAFQNREDRADVWLGSGNSSLGGKRPKDYCVDKATFSTCERLLKKLPR
jgi:hypothetical protein